MAASSSAAGGAVQPAVLRYGELRVVTCNIGMMRAAWAGRRGDTHRARLAADLGALHHKGCPAIFLQELGSHEDPLPEADLQQLLNATLPGWIHKIDRSYVVLANTAFVVAIATEYVSQEPGTATGLRWSQHGKLQLAQTGGVGQPAGFVGFANVHLRAGARVKTTIRQRKTVVAETAQILNNLRPIVGRLLRGDCTLPGRMVWGNWKAVAV